MRWQCARCGSFEKRKSGSGCAECHRRNSVLQVARKRLLRMDDEDIPITPAMRTYLEAFDRFILANRDGDFQGRRVAAEDKAKALRCMEGI